VQSAALAHHVAQPVRRHSRQRAPAARPLHSPLPAERSASWLANAQQHFQHPLDYTHTHPFNGLLSGTTRVSRYQKGKPIWILLKQETVRGNGISWAICKSAPLSRQITMQHPTSLFFTGRMPVLPPNQQRQSIGLYIAPLNSETAGWLGSRVASILDSGAEGPRFKSQLRRCLVTVLGELFTPTVPLFTKQRNW